MFCLVRSTMVVICALMWRLWILFRHTQETSRPRFILAVGSHPQTSADRCRAAGKLFAVCAFEVSGGIYLSEMKSVLKRIHRGISERSAISYAAAETRHAYSISLQSTAATRGSWSCYRGSLFYDTKLNKNFQNTFAFKFSNSISLRNLSKPT